MNNTRMQVKVQPHKTYIKTFIKQPSHESADEVDYGKICA